MKKNIKKFKSPELEIIKLDKTDILTESAPKPKVESNKETTTLKVKVFN